MNCIYVIYFLSRYKKSNLPAGRQAKEANRILDEIKKLKPVSPQAGLLRCAKMRAYLKSQLHHPILSL